MKRLLLAFALLWPIAAGAVDSSTILPNANYSVLITDSKLVVGAPLTANRTVTLPSAGATLIGQGYPATGPSAQQTLEILDPSNYVGGSNSCLIIAPATGELINNSSSNLTFCSTGGTVVLYPMSGTAWTARVYGPGQVMATSTNDNAQAGYIGEYLNATKNSQQTISLSSGTPAGIVSVALTPGDWDCFATISRSLGSTTNVTLLEGAISTVSAVTPVFQGTEGVIITRSTPNVPGVTGADQVFGPIRESLSANTTIFLNVEDTFTVSTDAAFGQMRCRRVR